MNIDFRTQFLLKKITKDYQISEIKTCDNINKLNFKKVLIIAPHADDEVIGCGATIDFLINNKVQVIVVIVTKESSKSIAKSYNIDLNQRINESYKAKDILSYNELIYFNIPELELDKNGVLQNYLVDEFDTLINNVKPDTIFIPNALELHPDHRITGKLLLEKIGKERKYSFLKNVLIYEVWGPVDVNMYLLFSNKTMDIKNNSLSCYKSQLISVHYHSIMNFINSNRGHEIKKYLNIDDNDKQFAECFKLINY